MVDPIPNEQAPVAGSVPGTCAQFLPPAPRNALLAAVALIRAVAIIPESVSDPGVALVKLKWWRDALVEAVKTGSHQHPLIRAALEARVFEQWNVAAWENAILAFGLRCDAGPFSDQAELLEWCTASSGMAESALFNGAEAVRQAGMAYAMLQRLEEWVVNGGSPGWLPLDLLARHGTLPTSSADKAAYLSAQAKMLGDLAAATLARWQTSPMSSLGPEAHGRKDFPLGAGFCLRNHVVVRRLEVLGKSPEKMLKRGVAPSLAETWSTWRAARQLAAKMRP